MTSNGIAHESVHCSDEYGNSVRVHGVRCLCAGTRFRRARYEDGHQCTSGRCPYESPSGSLAPLGCRAACATRPQFKRKSQTQEKRSEQSIAPDRLHATGETRHRFVCVGKTLCHGRGLSERGLQIVLYIDHGAGDTHAAVPEFGDCARTMDASGFMSTQTRHFSVSSVSEPVSHGARSLGRQS